MSIIKWIRDLFYNKQKEDPILRVLKNRKIEVNIKYLNKIERQNTCGHDPKYIEICGGGVLTCCVCNIKYFAPERNIIQYHQKRNNK